MSIEQPDILKLITSEYTFHLLREGKSPVTVFKFCEDLGISEADFYNYFSSFKSVEKSIWQQMFTNVTEILMADENYPHYSVYEKWLSFLYTLIEEFKLQRSLVVFRCEDLDYKNIHPWFLDKFRLQFKEFSKDLINDGLSTEELATRPIVSGKYNEALWFQLLYIIRVWINDESEDFQTTDAAVEKTSALLFEMMKKGPVDLLIDFAKFAYQNKAY